MKSFFSLSAAGVAAAATAAIVASTGVAQAQTPVRIGW